MIIGVDYDNMLTAFPEYFKVFFDAMQRAGNKVGVITGELESKRSEIEEKIKEFGVTPDFLVMRPDDFKDFSVGVFKGIVCLDLEVDVLYDDFSYNNPRIICDFFTTNNKTIPMTSFGYRPDIE